MPDPDAFHANLQRGIFLRDQGRPKEAVSFIQAAIAANPDAPEGYAELGRCWIELPKERGKAIKAIDRAIALDPTNSYYFGLKGWFFVCLHDFRAAQCAAEQGLAFDPQCIRSLNALANAYTKLNKWKKAEATCRRILEIDPNDAPGLNLFAQALRYQGRWKESRAAVHHLLALLPNNAFGQMNAGFGALAAGDHLRANDHFLQALRMDPHCNLARQGLLKSLRARIWIVRFNHRIMAFLQWQPTPRELLRGALIFGAALLSLVFIMIVGEMIHPGIGLGFIELLLAAVTLSFLPLTAYVYLSFIMAVLGNFLLMFDPLGRHALTRYEKIRDCLPAVVFGLIMLLIILAGFWPVALGLVLVMVFLAFTIQFPLLKDRWQRRHESDSSN